MCGIAGIISKSLRDDELRTNANFLASSLNHRGPDNRGFYIRPEEGVALVHARLSVIDTSSFGNQPMKSKCGRFIIIFNGEIYNFREIREQLEKLNYKFLGTSDTEVFLACIAEFGWRDIRQKDTVDESGGYS